MDKITGSVNSHIQIPKSVLQGFSFNKNIRNEKGYYEKHKFIFQMDMDGTISEIDIKDVNTKFGYYEDIIEKEVLSSIETAFGDIKAKAIQLVKSIGKDEKINLNITANDLNAVKKYCALCFVRSEEFTKGVQQKSIMLNLIANEPQNTVIYTYLKYPQLVDDLFANLNLFIIINASNTNLLLPQSGMIMRQSSTSKALSVFVPITEKICFMLSTDSKPNFILQMDEKFADKLNKFMIESEYNNNHRAVFAKYKSDLENYKDYLMSLHLGN